MSNPHIHTRLNDEPIYGYYFTDWDDDSDPSYYSFVNKDGAWYIKRIYEANKSCRYAKGLYNYVTNWTNHESLSYDYIHEIF